MTRTPATLQSQLTAQNLPEIIIQTRNFLLEENFPESIDAAVILGSGLGGFGDEISNRIIVPYSHIPGFPQSTVVGHSGSLICGSIKGKTVLAFSGRFHHYEGHDFSKTIIPVQLAKAFQAQKLIISNAAGGINLRYRVGDLMIIDSIIRQFMKLAPPANRLWTTNLEKDAWRVKNIADGLGIATQMGTYLYVKGPNYESKAEIHAFRKMGGDAVGMSTAPELIEAARLEVKTAAISLITNAAAGVTDAKLNHDEVKEAAESKKEEFAGLVKGLIAEF